MGVKEVKVKLNKGCSKAIHYFRELIPDSDKV
jgi:hypothetical protein